jgi:DNA-binding NarL/FixJ family response regulator
LPAFHITGPEQLNAEALPDGLSQREVQVLRMIAAGRSNREIAEELVLSVRTVERHIANLYAKAGLHTKAQAASYAHQNHLI